MTDIHSCSYYCDRPECIKSQRDELRGWFEGKSCASVPDAKWVELAGTLEKFVPSGGPGPLWGAGAAFAYCDVAKTIRSMLHTTSSGNESHD